jgi:iron(III) transport system ATP-binding protein
MHDGRVLQAAPPETIYTWPASRTVAAFFGSPNPLEGKTREVRHDGEAALARGRQRLGGLVRGARRRAGGEAVTVVVRPEMIQLGARPPGMGIAWRGLVRQRFFRGARNVSTVEAAGHRLGVDAPPDQSLALGATVALAVDAAHTWLVRPCWGASARRRRLSRPEQPVSTSTCSGLVDR